MGTETTALSRPEYLYKYSSASRVAQIVGDLTFYFAPVSQLNDLFEFRARSLYMETPESKLRVFAKRLVMEKWYTSYTEAFEAIKDGALADAVGTTYEEFLNTLHFFLQNIMQYSGVTCFSSHRNNQRMWGTYGDNHSGAVIEFTTSPNHSKFASHLMPVLYTANRFPICPSEFISDSFEFNQWLCGVFCCIKHIHWWDEAEWRLLMLADHEQSRKDRVISFERSAITRIVLGPRITPENEKLIHAQAAKHSPQIPVFKRVIDDAEAKEEIIGVERIHSFEQLKYWAEKCSRNS